MEHDRSATDRTRPNGILRSIQALRFYLIQTTWKMCQLSIVNCKGAVEEGSEYSTVNSVEIE